MPTPKNSGFDPVEDAISEIANGRMVIVTDDEDRENEGDLVMAASTDTVKSVRWASRLWGTMLEIPSFFS